MQKGSFFNELSFYVKELKKETSSAVSVSTSVGRDRGKGGFASIGIDQPRGSNQVRVCGHWKHQKPQPKGDSTPHQFWKTSNQEPCHVTLGKDIAAPICLQTVFNTEQFVESEGLNFSKYRYEVRPEKRGQLCDPNP